LKAVLVGIIPGYDFIAYYIFQAIANFDLKEILSFLYGKSFEQVFNLRS
jgi:hypothetical protein